MTHTFGSNLVCVRCGATIDSDATAKAECPGLSEREALLALERLVRRHHGREDGGDPPYPFLSDCEECRALARLDEVRRV